MPHDRRRRNPTGRVLAVALAVTNTAGCTGTTRSPRQDLLVVERDVALPGTTSRFDYQSIDPTNHQLWIAHLGDNTVIAIDLGTLTVAATVPDISQVHGVLAVADLHRAYATATGTNEIVAIDTTTHQIVTRAPTGAFPDGLAYDPDHHLLLASNKTAGTITIHDPDTLATIRTIKIAEETGNVAYDPATGNAYAASRPPDQLTRFDPTTGVILATIALPDCHGAHGLLIDPDSPRAFVACENNARMVTVDLATDTTIATSHVGSDPDVLANDPSARRLYLAAESGNVTTFDTSTREPRQLGTQHLNNDAHSVAIDPATHQAYFPLADLDLQPTLRVTSKTNG